MKGSPVYKVSKTFSFCYGHRLLNDSGKCRNLHGHSARATFVLGSDGLDEMGMVCHFDRLKETVGKWISETLDHTMILAEDDPIAATLKEAGERIYSIKGNPTAENLACMFLEIASGFGLPVISVEVWESDTSKAEITI